MESIEVKKEISNQEITKNNFINNNNKFFKRIFMEIYGENKRAIKIHTAYNAKSIIDGRTLLHTLLDSDNDSESGGLLTTEQKDLALTMKSTVDHFKTKIGDGSTSLILMCIETLIHKIGKDDEFDIKKLEKDYLELKNYLHKKILPKSDESLPLFLSSVLGSEFAEKLMDQFKGLLTHKEGQFIDCSINTVEDLLKYDIHLERSQIDLTDYNSEASKVEAEIIDTGFKFINKNNVTNFLKGGIYNNATIILKEDISLHEFRFMLGDKKFENKLILFCKNPVDKLIIEEIDAEDLENCVSIQQIQQYNVFEDVLQTTNIIPKDKLVYILEDGKNTEISAYKATNKNITFNSGSIVFNDEFSDEDLKNIFQSLEVMKKRATLLPANHEIHKNIHGLLMFMNQKEMLHIRIGNSSELTLDMINQAFNDLKNSYKNLPSGLICSKWLQDCYLSQDNIFIKLFSSIKKECDDHEACQDLLIIPLQQIKVLRNLIIENSKTSKLGYINV